MCQLKEPFPISLIAEFKIGQESEETKKLYMN